jgi:hypothetical protein
MTLLDEAAETLGDSERAFAEAVVKQPRNQRTPASHGTALWIHHIEV